MTLATCSKQAAATVRGAAAVVATVGLALAFAAPARAADTVLLTLTATADTYVDASTPTTSYGTQKSMGVDGSPVKQAFLRFAVKGVNGRQVVGARLRLFQRDASADGGRVYAMSDTTWSEGMTWDTRPAIDGPQLAAFGRVSVGNTYEVNMGGAVTGDGDVSFAITSPNADGNLWATREYTAAPPQLILEVERGAPVYGLSAVSLTGSSDPTYYTAQQRVAMTEGGRTLVVYGKHKAGVQLAWRDYDGLWSEASTGRVTNGLLLGGTGTGDWPASIAVARDAAGVQHAWVVWSGPSATSVRPVQMVRLSNLDAPGGPSVGPIVTVQAAGLGNGRPDIGFEQAPDGTTRGVLTWQQRTGDTAFDLVTAWFSDLGTDAPEVTDRTTIQTGNTSGSGSTLVTGGAVRAVTRAGGYLTVMGHEPGTPLATWWTGPRGLKAAGLPSATSLDSGDILAAVESDRTTHVVQVQRFTQSGVPAAPELRLDGYSDPSVSSDGTRAWIVMLRTSDGQVVSRQYDPLTGWSADDQLEIGSEGGGGYRYPNALRRVTGALSFVVRGPDQDSTGSTSTVLGFTRPL